MKYVTLFLITHAIFVSSHAQQTEAPDSLKEKLIALEKQSWEAWKNQDTNFFSAFLSDDHIELGYYGTSSKKDVVSFIASHACNVQSYNVSEFSVKMLDTNIAVLTYHAEQNTICQNKVPSPVWVSSIYINRNGKWENVFYQQTQALN
jgi:hypothetical protein